jgi:hypothetical protein
VFDDAEYALAKKMFDIPPRAGRKIVDAYDLLIEGDEPFTEVGTEKAGPSRNSDARHDDPFEKLELWQSRRYVSDIRYQTASGLTSEHPPRWIA